MSGHTGIFDLIMLTLTLLGMFLGLLSWRSRAQGYRPPNEDDDYDEYNHNEDEYYEEPYHDQSDESNDDR